MNTCCIRETISNGKNHHRRTPGTKASVPRQSLILPPRHVTHLKIPARARLEVESGVCWLTSNRDNGDIILRVGQTWEAQAATELLASALGEEICRIGIVLPH